MSKFFCYFFRPNNKAQCLFARSNIVGRGNQAIPVAITVSEAVEQQFISSEKGAQLLANWTAMREAIRIDDFTKEEFMHD